MMKRCPVLPVAALALAAVVHAPATASAQPGADNARARELFKKGREEYAKDHVKEAYALFRDAWAVQKSFDIAGNLAVVEKQLGHPRDAAEHAAFALANFPAGGTDTQRKVLQEVLDNAKTTCGSVTVRVGVDRALVTVDGKLVGESPLPTEVFTDPGSHTFVATAPGCDPVKDSVLTDRGSQHLLNLIPTHCGPKPPKPPGGDGIRIVTPLPPPPPRPLTVAGFITTGVGLGLGTAFAIMAKIKADNADSLAHGIPGAATNPNACAVPTTTNCMALYDTLGSHDTFANAAIWTFVAAGAVGIGTVIYTFAVPRDPVTVKPAVVQAIPVVGPGTGGLVLKGAF